MGILSIGASFRRAPVDLLDRLAYGDEDLSKAYRHARDLEGLDEVVILSTCNRVEVVGRVDSYHAGFLALKRLLTETRDVEADELGEALYAHWERDAADHLFGVASGLDSLVLGETQIQAQVRDALRRAEADGAAGPELGALFHAANRAGRRVRRETALGAAPDAYVAHGAAAAAAALEGLEGRVVVVVGAGRMASLAVDHLAPRGVASITVLNRSVEHAEALAARAGARSGDLATLPRALAQADLVISATGAAGAVVGRDDVARATAGRTGRPLVLLDLAVPRDVEPACAELDGVTVLDVVALRERVRTEAPETAEQLSLAHAIVTEDVRRWAVRRRGDELAPLIRALQERGDEVVRAELDRWSARLAALEPEEREAVEALARAVAAKLLHDPIVRLKERTEPGGDRAHAALLAELLAIELPDER
ncbi:MAG TPA: glutamyl-tRNA reductase [Actinomycetota bacterium]|nr:glutamyl-tRNA reductase [Actinomycetota bacterium]